MSPLGSGGSSPVDVRDGRRRSAGVSVRRLQNASEVAELEPAGEGLDERPGAFQLDAARAHRLSPDEMAGPDPGERADVGVNAQIDLEARILYAHVHARALQHEPGRTNLKASRRHAAEIEPHDHARRGQAGDVDAAVHRPHQERGIEVVPRELMRGVTLTPLAETLHDLTEFLAGLRESIIPATAATERRARDHARVLELVKALRQERPGDERHPAPDLVEPARAREQLA